MSTRAGVSDVNFFLALPSASPPHTEPVLGANGQVTLLEVAMAFRSQRLNIHGTQTCYAISTTDCVGELLAVCRSSKFDSFFDKKEAWEKNFFQLFKMADKQSIEEWSEKNRNIVNFLKENKPYFSEILSVMGTPENFEISERVLFFLLCELQLSVGSIDPLYARQTAATPQVYFGYCQLIKKIVAVLPNEGGIKGDFIYLAQNYDLMFTLIKIITGLPINEAPNIINALSEAYGYSVLTSLSHSYGNILHNCIANEWGPRFLKAAIDAFLLVQISNEEKEIFFNQLDGLANKTPLLFATQTARPEAVKILLEAMASHHIPIHIHAANTENETAIMIAALYGQIDVLRLLVQAGACHSLTSERSISLGKYLYEGTESAMRQHLNDAVINPDRGYVAPHNYLMNGPDWFPVRFREDSDYILFAKTNIDRIKAILAELKKIMPEWATIHSNEMTEKALKCLEDSDGTSVIQHLIGEKNLLLNMHRKLCFACLVGDIKTIQLYFGENGKKKNYVFLLALPDPLGRTPLHFLAARSVVVTNETKKFSDLGLKSTENLDLDVKKCVERHTEVLSYLLTNIYPNHLYLPVLFKNSMGRTAYNLIENGVSDLDNNRAIEKWEKPFFIEQKRVYEQFFLRQSTPLAETPAEARSSASPRV